ncbi:MAG: 50S ribosomal protein L6 [Candidatus Goldbacteria bacterium]|jgi:large subunit ribosomal protein L6|nr:50S ribosomal protein L6 [Candidatus Goldiibacteriota bacterium]
MSRIGKQPVQIPSGVKVSNDGKLLKIEGSKGKAEHVINNKFDYKIENNEINVVPRVNVEKDKAANSQFGTERAVIANKVKGVNEGYVKTLLLKGVGYRAQMQGTKITMAMGFSHPVVFEIPAGVKAEVTENQTKITVTGIDKQLVGETAAKLRKVKPPEPYQGKGIMYDDEHVIRKAGKSAAGAKGK